MIPVRVIVEIRGGVAMVVEKPREVEVLLVDFDGVGETPDILEHSAEEEIRGEGA